MTVNMFFGQTEIKIEVLILDRRCVFTSRLDLLTADSLQSSQPGLPPPYASPAISSASSHGSRPTSSSPTTPTLPMIAVRGKPDEIVGAIKPDDSSSILPVGTTLNKPHESGPGSPLLTDKHQMTSPLILTSSHQPPSSSNKTLPPSPPSTLLSSSTKELQSSLPPIHPSMNDEKTLAQQGEAITLVVQEDEKTLTDPHTSEPAYSDVSATHSSIRSAPPLPSPSPSPTTTLSTVAAVHAKKKSFRNKLLGKLKLA